MIAQLTTPRRQKRFRQACRGKLALGTFMALDAALFCKSQPWRFYAAPTLALELNGTTAWAAGHANPEELAGFLGFCGCEQVVLDDKECPPPAGWHRTGTLTVFGLASAAALPLPEVDETLWSQLTLDRNPPSGEVAKALYPEEGAKQEDLYSELCSKRIRSKAQAWALRKDGSILCTVGAYAIQDGCAYMACGQTDPTLRGRGIGGRLIVQFANEFAAAGMQPVFLCAEQRVHFYTRLGFKKLGEYAQYGPSQKDDRGSDPQEGIRRSKCQC